MRFVKYLALLVLLSLPTLTYAQQNTPTPLPQPTATAIPTVQAQAAEELTISVGDTVSGELTLAAPSLVYTFEGTEGDTIVISMVSDTVDTYLILEDASGDELARDDDSGGSADARIGPFTLPESGTYRIIAHSYSYERSRTPAEGEFTLSLTTFTTRRIEYTQRIEDELTTDALTAFYSFSGQAGDNVVILMESNDFDSYLTLTDSEGFELISNDDGAGNLNSLIGPFELPETGTYIVEARSFGGSGTGEYTLKLDRAELIEISYGETVEVELTERDNSVYLVFEGEQGDVIDITVTSSDNLDTTLSLNSPYNYQEARDDDSGEGLNPAIRGHLLDSNGRYLLLLAAPFGGSGSVEVTLERAELLSLDDGPQTVTFNSERSTAVVTFTGVEGASYRLTLRLIDGTTSSPSITLTQDGSSIGSLSAYSVTGASLEFTVPDDGAVLVEINEYSYSDLEFDVSLRKAE
jgi:hypothetical protein